MWRWRVQVARLCNELLRVAADRDQLRAAMGPLQGAASATRTRLEAALFQNKQLQVGTLHNWFRACWRAAVLLSLPALTL